LLSLGDYVPAQLARPGKAPSISIVKAHSAIGMTRGHIQMTTESLNLSDLKATSPKDLLAIAEELEIENASTMRKGEIMFQVLRERADEGWDIAGDGVLEVLQDGFGFLRSPEANYLPGPDDIYVSPDMIRKIGRASCRERV